MADSITVLRTSMVVPASPTVVKHMFLPSTDAFWHEMYYNTTALFFTAAPPDAAERLKASLSLALVHYYPWAGRLALQFAGSDDEKHYGSYIGRRLVIDCNDKGAEFIEASINCPISKLAATGFQTMTFYEKLCREVDYRGECLFTSPLLSVQVTQFSDGGLAIAMAQSHVVADGQSMCDFILSWGDCARGEALAIMPIHERERLALPNPCAEKARLSFVKPDAGEGGEEDRGVQEAENGHKETGVREEARKTMGDGREDDQPPLLLQCVFAVPLSAIQKLKALAGRSGSYSSFEVVCAHFWKRVTVARDHLDSPDRTNFFMSANMRSRLIPPLPASYFGNAIMFGTANACAATIASEPFPATVARVHAAVVSSIDPDNFHGFMHWLELHDNTSSTPLGDLVCHLQDPCIKVVWSPRFPVYDADFGWGPPVAIRPVKVYGDGDVVMFPSRPDSALGGIEICMALPAAVMRRFLRDREFLVHVQLASPSFDDFS